MTRRVLMKGFYRRNKRTGEKYYDGARSFVSYKRIGVTRRHSAVKGSTTHGARYHPRLYNQKNFRRMN